MEVRTREQIQAAALLHINANYGDSKTIVLSTGTGKSKVGIDTIKARARAKRGERSSGPLKVLITSPRSNLKLNWAKELAKWNIKPFIDNDYVDDESNTYHIRIVNIQTCYKWSKLLLRNFDLIIGDEVHTMVTEEYGQLIINAKELGIEFIGLTGTPDTSNQSKKQFYDEYCPIVFSYLDSAKDGIVNKRRYIIYEYELNDKFQVDVKAGKKQWKAGEKKQYDYFEKAVRDAELEILKAANIGIAITSETIEPLLEANRRYAFFRAKEWFWDKKGNEDQIKAGRKYMWAVTARKNLLLDLSSTRTLAREMIKEIHNQDSGNKVLVFSELTKQADSICENVIHSKVSKKPKEAEEINRNTLDMFDRGEIKAVASCNSLTLGVNIAGANYQIIESLQGSETQLIQKLGRSDRLDVDDVATAIFIVVKGTQSEKWFSKATENLDLSDAVIVTNFTEFREALNQ